jgi:hypothetical protein
MADNALDRSPWPPVLPALSVLISGKKIFLRKKKAWINFHPGQKKQERD